MTDNEIIKALECCKECSSPEYCRECPYVECTTKKGCVDEMLTDALDLINRQQAEIESLEAEIDKQYEQAKADILGNMADGGISCHWCIEQHKSEAIKEFAERLKEKAYLDGAVSIAQELVVDVRDINDLMEEMTEDGK